MNTNWTSGTLDEAIEMLAGHAVVSRRCGGLVKRAAPDVPGAQALAGLVDKARQAVAANPDRAMLLGGLGLGGAAGALADRRNRLRGLLQGLLAGGALGGGGVLLRRALPGALETFTPGNPEVARPENPTILDKVKEVLGGPPAPDPLAQPKDYSAYVAGREPGATAGLATSAIKTPAKGIARSAISDNPATTISVLNLLRNRGRASEHEVMLRGVDKALETDAAKSPLGAGQRNVLQQVAGDPGQPAGGYMAQLYNRLRGRAARGNVADMVRAMKSDQPFATPGAATSIPPARLQNLYSAGDEAVAAANKNLTWGPWMWRRLGRGGGLARGVGGVALGTAVDQYLTPRLWDSMNWRPSDMRVLQ